MKKFYFLLLTALTGIGFSQNILLSTPTYTTNGLLSPTNTIMNNDTIEFCVNDLVYTFEDGQVIVINTTGSAKNIKVRRYADQYSCFVSNQFCWVICYNPAVSLTPDHITVAANDSTNAFHGWVTPDESEGCCFIKYRFFDADDTTDFADVTLKYCFAANCSAPNLSNEEVSSAKLSVYPNPATDVVNADFDMINNSGAITLTDVSGKVVRTVVLGANATQQILQLNGLENGLYIYNLYNNEKLVSTKKIIINN